MSVFLLCFVPTRACVSNTPPAHALPLLRLCVLLQPASQVTSNSLMMTLQQQPSHTSTHCGATADTTMRCKSCISSAQQRCHTGSVGHSCHVNI
jgi:hypothetical protein